MHRQDITGATQALDALEGFGGEENLPAPWPFPQDLESEFWHFRKVEWVNSKTIGNAAQPERVVFQNGRKEAVCHNILPSLPKINTSIDVSFLP